MFNDNDIEFNRNFPRKCFIIGATGPTGPTHTLLSESKWYFLTFFLI